MYSAEHNQKYEIFILKIQHDIRVISKPLDQNFSMTKYGMTIDKEHSTPSGDSSGSYPQTSSTHNVAGSTLRITGTN